MWFINSCQSFLRRSNWIYGWNWPISAVFIYGTSRAGYRNYYREYAHKCVTTESQHFSVTGPFCGEFTSKFPTQRPTRRSFDVSFDLRLNKLLSTDRDVSAACVIWPCATILQTILDKHSLRFIFRLGNVNSGNEHQQSSPYSMHI